MMKNKRGVIMFREWWNNLKQDLIMNVILIIICIILAIVNFIEIIKV